MNNERQKYTNEQINEPRVAAEKLLEEIKPLLDECFEGEITLKEEGISYTLPNGQRFLICVKEVS